jgi:hypothetical protein
MKAPKPRARQSSAVFSALVCCSNAADFRILVSLLVIEVEGDDMKNKL